LTIKSGVHLTGSGWGSIIQARSNNRIIRAAPDGDFTATLKDARIDNLTIDGQMRNNPSWATGSAIGTCQGIGIELAADPTNYIGIDNVYIYDTRLEGGYFYRVGVDIGRIKTKFCGLGTENDGSGLAFDSCYDSNIDFLDARDVRGQWGWLVQSSTYPMTITSFLITNPHNDGCCVRGAENVNIISGSINNIQERGINIRGDIAGFGPCKNITIGPVYINNSIGGYGGISVYQAQNVTINTPTIENCYSGIALEGGATYNGHVLIYPSFKGGVIVPIYTDADGMYTSAGSGGGTTGATGANGTTGATGANGTTGATGATGLSNTFISTTVPVGTPPTYLWIQTGLGPSGHGFTFWVEDGL
jgi:hypothetical protein